MRTTANTGCYQSPGVPKSTGGLGGLRFRSVLTTRRLLLAAVLLAGVVAVIWRALPRDAVTKVTADQAQDKFQRLVGRVPSRGRAVEGLPPPGVYRYWTSGGEYLNAFLSASHDYSGSTTISIVTRSCGFEEEWRVLGERWSSARVCPGVAGALDLTRLREHHEFFGSVDDTVYTCRTETGATRCSSPRSHISYSTHRVGRTTIEVGGEEFAAVHFRARAAFTGENTGSGRIEEWRRASDGLLLQKKVTVAAEVASANGGEYGEQYQLRLLTSRPIR